MTTLTMDAGDLDALSAVECGDWLLAALASAESAEAQWLDGLRRFDELQGWAADGQLSCVEWLMWRARMSRTTAYEKLQVARQMGRRPILRDALLSGRISYSAARAMSRMVDPDAGADQALVALAEAGSVRDVERMVDHYLRLAGQRRRPADLDARRGVRVRPNYDGTSTIQITLEDPEVADFVAALEAFIDHEVEESGRDEADRDQSARADGAAGPTGSAGPDSPAGHEAPSARADGRRPWGPRAADALMEMAHTAIAHVCDGRARGDDRFLVHVISDGAGMTLLDGTALDEAAAAVLACQSPSTELLLGPGWEPLAMGRKTYPWTTAQRRAVLIRDGAQCRFPGCQSRHYLHVHHHQDWDAKGPTNVCNGYTICHGHHRLIHSGWTVTGQPNDALTFHRPDGRVLGETVPRLMPRTPR